MRDYHFDIEWSPTSVSSYMIPNREITQDLFKWMKEHVDDYAIKADYPFLIIRANLTHHQECEIFLKWNLVKVDEI